MQDDTLPENILLIPDWLDANYLVLPVKNGVVQLESFSTRRDLLNHSAKSLETASRLRNAFSVDRGGSWAIVKIRKEEK